MFFDAVFMFPNTFKNTNYLFGAVRREKPGELLEDGTQASRSSKLAPQLGLR